MKDYHRKVQEGLKLFAKTRSDHILCSNQRIIFVHHPTNKNIKPIEFHPDITFTTVDRRKCIFQVLHSQIRNKREIEADIVRAFLCDGVSKLIFIVKKKEEAELVKGIAEIIQGVLLEYGVKKESVPIAITIVIPDTIKSAQDAFEYFEEVDKRSKIVPLASKHKR